MTYPAHPRKPLGRTGIVAGAVTIGTSTLGRDTVPGSAEEDRAVRLARSILEAPFPLVDTANEYAGGRSEAVLGLARRALVPGVGRETGASASILTKVDRDPETGRFDRDRVLRSFEESLERLGVDHVPILHLHDPYTVTFAEAMSRGGAVAALIELRQSGAVGGIGIAAGPIPLMQAYAATGAFDVLLTHNRFSLVDRSAEPLLRDARARGMGVFNAAPFGAGILSTGSRPGATYGYRPASADLVAWVERAEAVCRRHEVALPTAALRFSTRSSLVDSTVVGISSPARLDQLDRMVAAHVPDDLWPELEALGPAPTPIADPPMEPTT